MTKPQLWVIAGPNGAGKTTLVTQRLADRSLGEQFEVVNPDVIAQSLPRIAGRLDERGAGEAAVLRRNLLLANGTSLAIETTLSGQSTLRFMRRARSAGYRITLVFVGIDSVELSAERVRSRVADGGHDVPVQALTRRYPDTMAKLPEAMATADRTYILDNSGKRRRLLMIHEDGRLRFLEPHSPDWFKAAVPQEMRRWPAGRTGFSQEAARGP